jgi:hypothetical protein
MAYTPRTMVVSQDALTPEQLKALADGRVSGAQGTPTTIKLAPEEPTTVEELAETGDVQADQAPEPLTFQQMAEPHLFEDAPGADFDLIEEKALASSLGVTLPTLVSWRKKGNGPRFTLVGKHIFYQEKEVFAWLDRHTFESGTSA